jgi:hypothetical protein
MIIEKNHIQFTVRKLRCDTQYASNVYDTIQELDMIITKNHIQCTVHTQRCVTVQSAQCKLLSFNLTIADLI